ncbi:MAG: SUMF1/EgtB/PvdO family nonheme iron enzyme [Armatimonas sp.]
MRRTVALALTAPIALGAIVLVRHYATAPPSLVQVQKERLATPSGMVYVPASEAIFGTDDPESDEDVRPTRHAYLPAFYIDKTEVTNAEFAKFQPSHKFPKGEENLPATGVTYEEATAYAKSVGKRLPTNDEWEKAARGTDGRIYPWGNTWDKAKVAARAKRPSRLPCGGYSRVSPAGSVPAGASPYGCLDMAGNAWEWVEGFYQNDPARRILRGGAVGYGERATRTYHRAIESTGAT